MLSALINGLVGTALTVGIATQVLGLSLPMAALCIAASNIAGFVGLLVIMRGHWVRGTFPTWALFLFTYFGILLSVAEPLRHGHNFAWLIMPVILSCGYAILAYGPVQDRLVARTQRKQRG